MLCPKCGKEITSDAKFCGSCGSKNEGYNMNCDYIPTDIERENIVKKSGEIITFEKYKKIWEFAKNFGWKFIILLWIISSVFCMIASYEADESIGEKIFGIVVCIVLVAIPSFIIYCILNVIVEKNANKRLDSYDERIIKPITMLCVKKAVNTFNAERNQYDVFSFVWENIYLSRKLDFDQPIIFNSVKADSLKLYASYISQISSWYIIVKDKTVIKYMEHMYKDMLRLQYDYDSYSKNTRILLKEIEDKKSIINESTRLSALSVDFKKTNDKGLFTNYFYWNWMYTQCSSGEYSQDKLNDIIAVKSLLKTICNSLKSENEVIIKMEQQYRPVIASLDIFPYPESRYDAELYADIKQFAVEQRSVDFNFKKASSIFEKTDILSKKKNEENERISNENTMFIEKAKSIRTEIKEITNCKSFSRDFVQLVEQVRKNIPTVDEIKKTMSVQEIQDSFDKAAVDIEKLKLAVPIEERLVENSNKVGQLIKELLSRYDQSIKENSDYSHIFQDKISTLREAEEKLPEIHKLSRQKIELLLIDLTDKANEINNAFDDELSAMAERFTVKTEHQTELRNAFGAVDEIIPAEIPIEKNISMYNTIKDSIEKLTSMQFEDAEAEYNSLKERIPELRESIKNEIEEVKAEKRRVKIEKTEHIAEVLSNLKKTLSPLSENEFADKVLYETIQKKAEEITADIEKPVSEKLRITCAGIYNAGKSSLLNALCGVEFFAIGDVPTTASIDEYETDDFIYVDTPGLNANNYDNATAERAFRNADIMLFVSNMQNGGLNASEAEYLHSISDTLGGVEMLREQIIFVMSNKHQIEPDALDRIVAEHKSMINTGIGFIPENICCIDSKTYTEGVRSSEQILINESGIPVLRELINERLASVSDSITELRCDRIINKYNMLIDDIERLLIPVEQEYERVNKLYDAERVDTEKTNSLIEEYRKKTSYFDSVYINSISEYDLKRDTFSYKDVRVENCKTESEAKSQIRQKLSKLYDRRLSKVKEKAKESLNNYVDMLCYEHRSGNLYYDYIQKCNNNLMSLNEELHNQNITLPPQLIQPLEINYSNYPNETMSSIINELTEDVARTDGYYSLDYYIRQNVEIEKNSSYASDAYDRFLNFVFERPYYCNNIEDAANEICRDVEREYNSNITRVSSKLSSFLSSFYNYVNPVYLSRINAIADEVKRVVDMKKDSNLQKRVESLNDICSPVRAVIDSERSYE